MPYERQVSPDLANFAAAKLRLGLVVFSPNLPDLAKIPRKHFVIQGNLNTFCNLFCNEKSNCFWPSTIIFTPAMILEFNFSSTISHFFTKAPSASLLFIARAVSKTILLFPVFFKSKSSANKIISSAYLASLFLSKSFRKFADILLSSTFFSERVSARAFAYFFAECFMFYVSCFMFYALSRFLNQHLIYVLRLQFNRFYHNLFHQLGGLAKHQFLGFFLLFFVRRFGLQHHGLLAIFCFFLQRLLQHFRPRLGIFNNLD